MIMQRSPLCEAIRPVCRAAPHDQLGRVSAELGRVPAVGLASAGRCAGGEPRVDQWMITGAAGSPVSLVARIAALRGSNAAGMNVSRMSTRATQKVNANASDI